MSDLAGRVIVFTGGETGIGRATVLQVAAEGATVVIGGILEEEGAKTVQAVHDAGGSAEFHRVDVRHADQVDWLIDGAVRDHGRIDGLVNSAAIFDGFASGIDTTDALWDQIMNVNARGTFYACRAALRHMVKAGNGRIVNVASIGGLVGMADGASYTASKHAVVGLTKHLGCYYANAGITVNAVCPGAIETNVRGNSALILGADAPPMGGVGASQDWVKTAIPMQRKGKVEEISGVVGFLLSDKSSYVTAACFTADGGWTAK
jgi:NAD(P)-dependent dehydrogenase (short-subunit alcohol dehydrogenase family)